MAEVGREGGRFTEDERLKSVSAVQVHFRSGAEARKRKPGSGSHEAEATKQKERRTQALS